jgi:DNA-binding GntR family transcriptional regulator
MLFTGYARGHRNNAELVRIRARSMMQAKQGRADQVPRSLAEDPVVQGVIRAVSLKRIRPGAKLGEVQLANAFGVNRIHIRHVLAYLGSKGIVTQFPNRGAYVSEPSVEEARQVFQTRRILERAAIEALVPRLTSKDVQEIRNHAQREAADVKEDRWETLSLTGDFHALLGRLSGNEVLARFLDELILRTSLIIATYEHTGAMDCSPEAHPAIAEKIIDRDVKGAIDAMNAHLDAMESRLPLDAAPPPPEDIETIFAELGVGRVASRRRNRARKADAATSL